MEYIAHYGVKHRSGRYPWGSGKKNQSSKGTGKMGHRPSNLSKNKEKAYDAYDKAEILNGKAELAALEYGPNSKQYNKLSKQESKEYDKYKKYMKKDAAAENRKKKIKDFFIKYTDFVKTPLEKAKVLNSNNRAMLWMMNNNIQQQNANQLFMQTVHMNNMMNDIHTINTMHMMNMF